MAPQVFNFTNLKKIATLMRDHRPAQILNTLHFASHALRGFPMMRLPYEPLHLVLFVTARCNLHCIHCLRRNPASPRQPQRFHDMTLEFFRQILDRFPRAIAITVTGGEPLAHPQLFTMIHQAHEQRLKVRLFTNGTMVAGKVEALLKAPVEFLNVSLYGTDRENFMKVTGADGLIFDATLEGVAELARRRHSSGYPRILQTSFILTKDNLHQAIDFIRLSEKIGVDQVKLNSMRVHGILGFAESKGLGAEDQEVQDLFADLRQQHLQIPVFLPRLYRHGDNRQCTMPFRLLPIDGDGFIGPCCVEGTARGFDNFFKEPDLWNGPTMISARRALMELACQLPPICRDCEEMIPERPSLGC